VRLEVPVWRSVYTRALCSIEQVDCRTPGSDSENFFLSRKADWRGFCADSRARRPISAGFQGEIALERGNSGRNRARARILREKSRYCARKPD
jgi:hypothetical protein